MGTGDLPREVSCLPPAPSSCIAYLAREVTSAAHCYPWTSEILAAWNASFAPLASSDLRKISEPQALRFSDERDGTCRAFDFCHWLRGCTLRGCPLKIPPTTHPRRILPPDMMYTGVSAPPASSQIPAECHAIQLTSDTVYLETASDCRG